MKVRILAIVAMGLITTGLAQQLPASEEAGRIEQRFQPPAVPRSSPLIEGGVERSMPRPKALAINFVLTQVSLSGATVFSDAQLKPLYSEYIGRQITAQDAFEIADNITRYYARQGYLLSRAIVPPQAMQKNGAQLRIRVIEGFIDTVIWPDAVDKRHQTLLNFYSKMITAHRPANNKVIERYMLLANDLPGLRFRYVFRPSTLLDSAATLEVQLEPQANSHKVQINNRGTDSTGPVQLSLVTRFNNPFSHTEKLDVTLSTADFNGELVYGAMQYQRVLSGEGLSFEVSANVSRGEPSDATLKNLNFTSNSENISLALNYPVVRSRVKNSYAVLSLDFKHSRTESFDVVINRDRTRVLRALWQYDQADKWRGINQFSVQWSKGIDGLGSTANNNPLASRKPGQVAFDKFNASASRSQALPHHFVARLSGHLQRSTKPLLSSEECGFGGQRYGRGLDNSVITGDECHLLSFELAYRSARLQRLLNNYFNMTELYSFADYGKVKNAKPPLGSAQQDSAASIGIGLRLQKTQWLSLDFLLSKLSDHPNSTTPQDDSQAWLQLTASF